ncbi:MAG: hypothetical protein Kow00133_06370 [Amphiplicatus sp.]
MARRAADSEKERLLARAKACLAAFGADPARWPADVRGLYARLDGDPDFAEALARAVQLDEALDLYAAPRMDEAAKARLLQRAPRVPDSSLHERRVLQVILAALNRRLVPVGALAAACVLGFAAGALNARWGGGAREEALVYAEAAMNATFQEKDVLWATDEQ